MFPSRVASAEKSYRAHGTKEVQYTNDECEPLVAKNNGRSSVEDSITKLLHILGFKFLLSVFIIRILFDAGVAHMIGRLTAYMFRIQGVSGPHLQMVNGVIALPVALEPCIGMMSDLYPINGYHKLPYMLMASALGAPAFLVLGWVPSHTISFFLVVSCLFLGRLQLVTCCSLMDAICLKRISENMDYGAIFVSVLQLMKLVFGCAGALTSGWLSQDSDFRQIFLVAAVLAVLVFVPLVSGWIVEGPDLTLQTQKSGGEEHGQRAFAILAVLVCLSSCVLGVAGIYVLELKTTAALAVLLVSQVLWCYTQIDFRIGRILMYALITHSLRITTSGAAYYFYTDSREEYPEGPHLSTFAYLCTMHCVGLISGCAGCFAFMKYMKRWCCRDIIFLTIIVSTLCRCTDILLFSRANTTFGVPDKMLIFGEEVIEPILTCMRAMPLTLLMASLCPRGMEATVNGLFAGAMFLGDMAAKSFGALLLSYFRCEPSGHKHESAHFENLWKVVSLAICLQLIVGIGALALIPAKYPEDD